MLEDKISELVKKAVSEENKENQKNYIFEKKKLFSQLGDNLVGKLKQYKAFVAGGSICSLFCNRDINDVDIYFRNKNDAADFVYDMIEYQTWSISHTKKATLFKYNELQCHVIHFDYFDNVNDIFDKFDFTICMGAYDFDKDQFVFHPEFLKHNSQRLLKFNENTAYPIISAMRVQKYEDKGYKISKPEWVKILLTCANLKIATYEQLKSQIGGMYGINYDKIIKPLENEPFDLMKVISKFNDMSINDEYFKEHKPEIPNNLRDIVYEITGGKIKVVKVGKNYYEHISNKYELTTYDEKNPDKYEIEEFKTPFKFYKFVKKDNDKYLSFFDCNFEYKIGEVAIARDIQYNGGLYGGQLSDYKSFGHYGDDKAVMIELEVDNADDIIYLDPFKAKKAKFIREVPKSEYVTNGKDEDDFDF